MITPSQYSLTAPAVSTDEIPKPTHIGVSVLFFTSCKYSFILLDIVFCSPVVPAWDTQYTKPFEFAVILFILSFDVGATRGIKSILLFSHAFNNSSLSSKGTSGTIIPLTPAFSKSFKNFSTPLQ